ncbi:MAG: transposase [Bacteroidetes Order II. Incertae sedis bacterium]|nr:transposase [Bacteroidetes Order II. bacterium]
MHLLVKPRKNMKKSKVLVALNNVTLMKKRGVIESVNDILTSVFDLEHTRHRKVENSFAHMVCTLIAYQSGFRASNLPCHFLFIHVILFAL